MTSEKPRKHLPVIAIVGLMLGVMIGLVVASPTLYKVFCSVTGFAGTVNRSTAQKVVKEENPDAKVLTIHFDSNVAPGLDWDFWPEKRTVQVKVGQPTKIYYRAKNNADKPLVGRAVYNITPYKAAPYFFKIECFCFTEEQLAAGQEARMPLVFYVDEQIEKEKSLKDVTDITLSYTFYKQDSSAEKVKAARDLKAGSEKLDKSLQENPQAAFANDAPRE